jgi:2-alkyl-3-oxoalkanoate reductase
MKILVTGAGGFLGRYVVAAAGRAGHDVVALLRPSSLQPIEGAAVRAADLRDRKALPDVVADADAVIHLAARKAGDFHTQFASTVLGTENLLWSMRRAGVRRLVGVSTFSVYGFRALSPGSLVDEETPLESHPDRRDEYARTKLLEEELFHDFAHEGHDVVVLRPGLIFGRGELWHALLGAEFGSRRVRIGKRAVLPLLYVENAAEAIVGAAERGRPGSILNLVDDDLPTQQRYVEILERHGAAEPAPVVPWPLARGIADLAELTNRWAFGGRASLPGIIQPDRLHGRFKPLRYTNEAARRELGWSPRFGVEEAVVRSVSSADLFALESSAP